MTIPSFFSADIGMRLPKSPVHVGGGDPGFATELNVALRTVLLDGASTVRPGQPASRDDASRTDDIPGDFDPRGLAPNGRPANALRILNPMDREAVRVAGDSLPVLVEREPLAPASDQDANPVELPLFLMASSATPTPVGPQVVEGSFGFGVPVDRLGAAELPGVAAPALRLMETVEDEDRPAGGWRTGPQVDGAESHPLREMERGNVIEGDSILPISLKSSTPLNGTDAVRKRDRGADPAPKAGGSVADQDGMKGGAGPVAVLAADRLPEVAATAVLFDAPQSGQPFGPTPIEWGYPAIRTSGENPIPVAPLDSDRQQPKQRVVAEALPAVAHGKTQSPVPTLGTIEAEILEKSVETTPASARGEGRPAPGFFDRLPLMDGRVPPPSSRQPVDHMSDIAAAPITVTAKTADGDDGANSQGDRRRQSPLLLDRHGTTGQFSFLDDAKASGTPEREIRGATPERRIVEPSTRPDRPTRSARNEPPFSGPRTGEAAAVPTGAPTQDAGVSEMRSRPLSERPTAAPVDSSKFNPLTKPAVDSVTLKIADADGNAARVRVVVRGDQVRTTIVHQDPIAATRLAGRSGDLQRSLSQRGFAESAVSVQVPKPVTESTMSVANGPKVVGEDGDASGSGHRSNRHESERQHDDRQPDRETRQDRNPRDSRQRSRQERGRKDA